ncbi:uroporphyrinogen-III synthase [Porticoccus sp. GXU_MW_L64]
MNLAGKRVLVIRPKPLAALEPDQFVEQLATCGARPLHLPVMAIQPCDIPLGNAPTNHNIEQIKSRVLALANYQAVIVVSRPAALLAGNWIDHCWPQLPVGVQFYAVGESSRQVLAAQGIEAQAPNQNQTSEGLLQLPALQQLHNRKVLICKGEGGREFLADQLQQRGAQVDELNLYSRCSSDQHRADILSALQNGVSATVAHSAELLDNLLSQVPEALHADLFILPLVVPSERIAGLARDRGFVNLQVANSAVPGDMVSAVSRCYISD